MISLFPHFDGKWLLTASHLWDKWHYQLLIWYFFGGQSAFHHLWQKWSIFSRLSSLPIPLHWHPMTAATYFGVFNCLMFNYSTQETLFSETSIVIWLKWSTSRFLENHTVPVRSICAKQTNISFFSAILCFMGFVPCLPSFSLLTPMIWCCQQSPSTHLCAHLFS